jgi:hypothetical protein
LPHSSVRSLAGDGPGDEVGAMSKSVPAEDGLHIAGDLDERKAAIAKKKTATRLRNQQLTRIKYGMFTKAETVASCYIDPDFDEDL